MTYAYTGRTRAEGARKRPWSAERCGGSFSCAIGAGRPSSTKKPIIQRVPEENTVIDDHAGTQKTQPTHARNPLALPPFSSPLGVAEGGPRHESTFSEAAGCGAGLGWAGRGGWTRSPRSRSSRGEGSPRASHLFGVSHVLPAEVRRGSR